MSTNRQIEPLPSLLLLDDDEVFLSVLCKAMSKRGYLVWPANTVTQAIQMTETDGPQFAVIDLHVSNGNGLDLLNHLQENSPRTHSVILSGYANLPNAVSAIKMGAVDCLAKPVDPDELDKALISARTGKQHIPDEFMPPEEARMQHILSRWLKNGLNTTKAAQELGLHRRSLQRMLRRVGLGSKSNPMSGRPNLLKKFPGLSLFWARAIEAQTRQAGNTRQD